MSLSDKAEPYYFVGVLRKAADIVEALSRHDEMSIAELVICLGQDRNAVNRIILTLQDLGYISRQENRRYKLTLKMFQQGSRALDNSAIYRVISKYMRILSQTFGETVCLGQRHQMDVVTIDRLSGNQPIQYSAHIGNVAPLYATSMGKCILAAMSDDELEDFLNKVTFKKFTPKSLAGKEPLMEEVRRVRKRGFALDDKELSEGVRCLGIPVYGPSGRCSQAMSVSGPAAAFRGERLKLMSEKMLEIKAALADEMNLKVKA